MKANCGLSATVEPAASHSGRGVAGDADPVPPIKSRGGRRLNSRRRRQGGQDLTEFSLVIAPLLLSLFFVLDIAWLVYSQATLQYAVVQGVRYAITLQTTGGMGLFPSIKTTVQQNAFNGMLGRDNSSPYWNKIVVTLYTAEGTYLADSNQSSPPASADGIQTDGSAPLVEVSVTGYKMSPFMPTVTDPGKTVLAPVILSARSWDLMEVPSLNGAPSLN